MNELLLILKLFTPQMALGIVGAILLLILIIYIISSITGKNFGFELGPIKINTKKNGKESPIEKIKTLLAFDISKENKDSLIDSICNVIRTKTREKDIIEFQQTVINQMTCAEDFNIQIKMLITESYAKLMKSKDETQYVRHSRDYKYYQILVSSILDELKRNTLRESIKSLDIAELSQLDFEQFVDQKINVMISQIDQYLELMYQNTSLVSWDEVHTENELISPKIRDLYRTLYTKIKTVAIEDSKNIQGISEQINNDVDKFKNQMNGDDVVKKIEIILEDNDNNKTKG